MNVRYKMYLIQNTPFEVSIFYAGNPSGVWRAETLHKLPAASFSRVAVPYSKSLAFMLVILPMF